MTTATFSISAFGDEIASKLSQQLASLTRLEIPYLDLRGVWDKNVLHLDDEEARKVRKLCDAANIGISCIGSPIGKSAIVDPIENELTNLARIFKIAEIVGTRTIRIFSFYPPDISSNEGYDAYVDDAAERLARLADLAAGDGFMLMLENEKEIVGDTVARCHALLTRLNHPHLGFIWDPANFVQVDERQVTSDGWPLLGSLITNVHIKDAVLSDGSVRPAGEGDGQVRELLVNLKEAGYQGLLSLEPHLAIAGHSGGFSGPDGMEVAVKALRKLMAETGCVESKG